MPSRQRENSRTRETRTQCVLSSLRALRQATTTQLAEACGISRPTVTAILNDLEALGIVSVTDSSTDGGRPARHYGFSTDPGFALAVDIHPDWLLMAAVTLGGDIVAAERAHIEDLDRAGRIAAVIDRLTVFLSPLQQRFGRLISVAVASTGIVDMNGNIVRSDLVPQWNGFPLARELAAALGCAVRVENDINAAAFGEYSQRAAANHLSTDDDLLYVTFSRGILTGLVLGGDIHRGRSCNAGEISDVLEASSHADPAAGPSAWMTSAVTMLGPLCVVVDPSLVVINPPDGAALSTITELEHALGKLRSPAAPPLPLTHAGLGPAAACVGALALALRDADTALIGCPPDIPPQLRGLDTIIHESRKGTPHSMTHENLEDRTPLRIGVVGVGARALLPLNAEESSVPAKIVAACEPHKLAEKRVRERLKREPDTITLTSTVSELIDSGIDAAFVTSPDDTHADITCELLEAGVPVYLEKPLAIHLDDATRVLETAYRTGTKLYLGHNMRHMNVVRTMRSLIREGRIGEVKAIWCRHFVGSGGDFYFKDWHATREHGTGLLLQKAAHDIDVMHWLADSHTTEVVGMGDLMLYDKVTSRADHSNELMSDWYSLDNWPPLSQQGLNQVIDVEDLSMMLMRMESGVLASYQQCHFTPDYWRNYTVIGTEGRLENFGDGEGGVIKLWNKRTHYNPDGDEQFPIIGDAQGHGDADKLTVDEFLRFITQDVKTDTNPLGAWYAVAAGIQATTSLRDGSTPREVPQLSPELVEYFTHNQSK